MCGYLLLAAQFVLFVAIADAQNGKVRHTPPVTSKQTGLVTTRLSAKELEKWREIEQIVFAENDNHQPWHPTLRNMWQWIETSGHTVYVEIVRLSGTPTCTAGEFIIERFDPLGEHHIAIIKLNLASINHAYVGGQTKRPDGFIPFLGLNMEERYAEVLGHELAHAVHILTSLERARRVEEIIQQTNAILLFQIRATRNKLPGDLLHRLVKRDKLLNELEAQAEEMEKVVWEELSARKPTRAKLLYLADNPDNNRPVLQAFTQTKQAGNKTSDRELRKPRVIKPLPSSSIRHPEQSMPQPKRKRK